MENWAWQQNTLTDWSWQSVFILQINPEPLGWPDVIHLSFTTSILRRDPFVWRSVLVLLILCYNLSFWLFVQTLVAFAVSPFGLLFQIQLYGIYGRCERNRANLICSVGNSKNTLSTKLTRLPPGFRFCSRPTWTRFVCLPDPTSTKGLKRKAVFWPPSDIIGRVALIVKRGRFLTTHRLEIWHDKVLPLKIEDLWMLRKSYERNPLWLLHKFDEPLDGWQKLPHQILFLMYGLSCELLQCRVN